MAADLWAKVVQRGILVREHDGTREALLMRNPDGTWELPGGKIEHGDTAAESLEREVEEETGLTVTSAEPVETAVRKMKKKKRGKFGVVYRCEFEGEAVTVSDEHVDCAWLDHARVGEVNLKQVDEYRSLRRVLRKGSKDANAADDADGTPKAANDPSTEGLNQ